MYKCCSYWWNENVCGFPRKICWCFVIVWIFYSSFYLGTNLFFYFYHDKQLGYHVAPTAIGGGFTQAIMSGFLPIYFLYSKFRIRFIIISIYAIITYILSFIISIILFPTFMACFGEIIWLCTFMLLGGTGYGIMRYVNSENKRIVAEIEEEK